MQRQLVQSRYGKDIGWVEGSHIMGQYNGSSAKLSFDLILKCDITL